MVGESGYSQRASAGATIVYADGSKGRLVYVKALVPRDLPWDVEGYRRVDRAFPMTGTEDQLYGEFDFEAYRELGWAVTNAALAARLDLFPRPEAEAGTPTAAHITAPRPPGDGPGNGTSST
jgi:hypothetical protein